MYQFESRIRYSETGEDGCLTLTGMINYLQDCSIFQSEDMGVGVIWTKCARHGCCLHGGSGLCAIPDRASVLRSVPGTTDRRGFTDTAISLWKMQAERGWQRRIPDGFCWTYGLVFPAESGRKILRPMGRRQRGFPWKRREE